MSAQGAGNEIWVLGATGRTGRAIAALLAGKGETPVLVGRDPARLRAVAEANGAGGGRPRMVTAGSVEAVAAELARSAPAVVVNTIGPFTRTAVPIARACLPGTHYLDLANELFAVTGLLALRDQAVAAGRSLVTGAGFGVLATESVVLRLCAARPAPQRVRVDAMPTIAAGSGPMGAALAASVIDAAAAGGRRYDHGRMVRTRLGGDLARITLPDGTTLSTVGAPSGELAAAHRASGAPFVVAASSEIPTGGLIRALLPVAARLLSRPALADAAVRRLARIRVPQPGQRREFSWARARLEYPDGTVREGWLRTGEAMEFTAEVAAEAAARLAHGEARPGTWTPGALFGPDLAVTAGAQFVLDAEAGAAVR